MNGNNRLILLLIISLILSSYTQHNTRGGGGGGEEQKESALLLLPRGNRIKNLTTNLNCKKSNNGTNSLNLLLLLLLLLLLSFNFPFLMLLQNQYIWPLTKSELMAFEKDIQNVSLSSCYGDQRQLGRTEANVEGQGSRGEGDERRLLLIRLIQTCQA